MHHRNQWQLRLQCRFIMSAPVPEKNNIFQSLSNLFPSNKTGFSLTFVRIFFKKGSILATKFERKVKQNQPFALNPEPPHQSKALLKREKKALV